MSRIISIGNVKFTTSCTCFAEYFWTMENFWICCNETGDALLSPEFLAANDSKPLIWCQLMFYPKGRTKEFKDYFSLFVKIVSKSDDTDIQEVSLSLYNYKTELITRTFNEPTQSDTSLWGAEDFFDRNSIINKPKRNRRRRNKAMKIGDGSDILMIILKIDTRKIEGRKGLLQSYRTMGNLNNDCAKLMNNVSFSDIELLIEDKTFRAHKLILVERSIVFAAVIENQMKANKDEKQLRIPNIKYEVCLEMLRYMYTDKVQGIDNIAADLLLAATRFCLLGLKRMCEKSLIKDVETDNVIERLQLGCWCCANMLKFTTIGFVIENPEIMLKPEFKKLPPVVLNEVYTARSNSITQ